jgi:group I intron endonuclease
MSKGIIMKYSGFVYIWTNNVTGIKYLGSHKGSESDGYIGSGLAFRNAIKKYGIKNFSREILEYIEDPSQIKPREQHFLDFYNCAKSKDYYNISHTSTGGNLGQDYLENGKKISETNKKNGHYEKLSKRMKENNPNKDGKARLDYIKKYGTPKRNWEPTPEFYEKCRQSKLGDLNPNKNGDSNRTKTFLVNAITFQIDHEFNGLNEAEKSMGVKHATVWYNRKRNRPHAGYYWCVGERELEILHNLVYN